MTRTPLVLALLLLAGCAQDETALLVTICTDVARSQADTLQLIVYGPAGYNVTESYSLDDVSLPYQISLRPGKIISADIGVRASLFHEGQGVVTRVIETRFVPGQDRDASIFLDTACVGQFCTDRDETCEAGACVAIGEGHDPCGGFGGDGDADADGDACDQDNDTYTAVECDGDDCDDDDPEAHPGGTEICDQIDNDCNGEADEGLWSLIGSRFGSQAYTDEQTPTLAAGNSKYGSAWTANRTCETDDECDSGDSCFDGDCGVREVLFVAQGLDTVTPDVSAQTVVSGPSPVAAEPMLGWNGSEWGLVYEDATSGISAVYFERIGSGGVGIGSPVRVSAGSERAYTAALAWTGRGWGTVWSQNSGGSVSLMFAGLDDGGSVVADSTVSSGASDALSGAIDWGDQRFGVAWIDGAGAGTIMFRILGEDGTPETDPLPVSDESGTIGDTVDVVWSGDGYAVVWDETISSISQIFFVHLDPDGAPLAEVRQIVSSASAAARPDIVYTGQELAVVWAEGPEGQAEIMLQRLTIDGDPQGGPVQVSDIDQLEGGRPSLAWNAGAGEYGILWQDERFDTDTDVWFNRYVCNDAS